MVRILEPARSQTWLNILYIYFVCHSNNLDSMGYLTIYCDTFAYFIYRVFWKYLYSLSENILCSCSDYIHFIGELVTLITDIRFIHDITGYVIATCHITSVIVIVTQIAVIILFIAVNIKLRLTHYRTAFLHRNKHDPSCFWLCA